MAKKILVVEDDPAALRLVQYTLQREGYEVITASNGLEGLKKATGESPDLLVLDVMLPGIDGFEIASRLRAQPATAGMPILMMSAKAREVDRATGLKAGADDYVTKPVAPAEISRKVAELLARKSVPPDR
ncbi:MAG: response regulator [Dehalococcoidia bacterium]|nr:response regulator [Dehalococcoidia bacterium]